jgi:hypothetical protein
MPEIGTSGLMSGERKRSVAEWPKLPRLSSTLRAHAGYGPEVVGRAKRSVPAASLMAGTPSLPLL